MSDMISRRKAIELIHSMYPSAPIMRINRKRWEEKYKPYIEAEKALEQLPSAQSEIVGCEDYVDWVHGFITEQDYFIPPKCGKYQ